MKETLLNNIVQSSTGYISLGTGNKQVPASSFEVLEVNDTLIKLLDLSDEAELTEKTVIELQQSENQKIASCFSAINELLFQDDSLQRNFKIETTEYKLEAIPLSNEKINFLISKKSIEDKPVIDEMPLAYQSLDEAGNIISINHMWCNLTGYQKEDITGSNFSRILHPKHQSKFFINFPKFKRHGSLSKIEYEIIKKDGSSITVLIDGKIAYNHDGSFRQTHCFLVDKTDQKKEELRNEKLMEEQALLNSTTSRLLGFNEEDSMLEYLGKVLFTKYPNSIININQVNDDQFTFNHFFGLNSFVIQKLEEQLGHTLRAKTYTIQQDIIKIFKSGLLSKYQADLSKLFEQLGINTKIAVFLKRLYKINHIYLHGIVKEDKLLAIVSIFTVGDSTIGNKFFIENLLQSAALILENKVNQSLLKTNKNFLDNVIENLPLGLQVFDKDGNSKQMNSRQANILGLKNRFEGINKFNVLSDPFSIENGSAAFYKQVYENKKSVNREIEIKLPSSSNQWDTKKEDIYLNEIAFPILNSFGQIDSVIALLKDITEKKKNDLALQESEERLTMALEGSGDGFWDWNLENDEVIFSDQWKQMLGFEVEEIKNNLEEWSSRVHPDDLERTIKDVEDHIAQKTNFYMNEHRMLCKDGSYKWILDRGKVITRNNDGKALRMIGTHSDITQRKIMENALRVSEENYRKLISSMHDGVVLQNKKGVILTCNQAAEKILGITADQMMGRNSIDPRWRAVRENGKDFPGSEHPAMYSLKTGLPQVNIIMGVHKPDGNLTWISINSEPIFLDGAKMPSHVVTTFFDITKIKKSEQNLKKARNELQQINFTKDRLFNIIGHDLKGPLYQIKELSALALKSLETSNTTEVQQYIQLMQQAAINSESLLVNLLEWSRLKTQKKSIKKEKFLLNDLMDDTLSLFSANLYRKNITISKHYDLDATVYANSNMIDTVIRNLISNAIKFSFSGTTIDIQIAKHPRNKIKVSVSDQGVGISTENMKKLHDNKQIFTLPGTNKEKGSGLGLVLCREFVEKNGGRIWIASEPGKGSTFSFSIPAEKKPK